MRQLLSRLLLFIGGLFAGVLLAGCGGGHQFVGTPTPYVPVPIVTGTPVTQALTGAAGQTVATGITGTTLVLPEGVTGSLTLAPILTGPPRPTDGGQGVRITAPNGAHVQVQVTVPDGEVAQCYVFGTMTGCLDGGSAPRTARWVPIPDGSHVGNVYTFDLPADAQTRLAGGGAIDSWVDHVNIAKMQAVANKARADISAALETLPEPLRTTATAAYQGDMAPSIAECSETDGSYYTGFGWFFPSRVCPYLAYRVTATDDVIAHETGHYLTHLLAGSAKFRTIIDLAPDENHALGILYGGRKTITEEYAYFQQFLTQGMVQYSSPMSGSWLAILSGKTPAQVDYPSLEGFGCSLMAALTRATVDTLRDFAKQATPTPAGALSKGEVLAVYADGASTIDALATVLETRMKAKGQGEAFRVIAERLGWSYQATGRVLSNKLTMQGVKVTPFVKVTQNGVTTTYTTPSVTTDVVGRFVLPRVFFGRGMLRLEYSGNTYDVPCIIDRAKSTIQYLTLPDIDLNLVQPILTGVMPDTGMPGDSVILVGNNFGATQPTNGQVLFSGVHNFEANATIISWSDTMIKVAVPPGANQPCQIYIVTGLDTSTENECWFFAGDGHEFLAALQQFTVLKVGEVDRDVAWPPYDWIGIENEQALTQRWGAGYTRTLTWNGPNFVARTTGSKNTPAGAESQTVEITGTLDPVRWRVKTITATLHHNASTSNGQNVQDTNIVLTDISGGLVYNVDDLLIAAYFGKAGSWSSSIPSDAVPTAENIVSYSSSNVIKTLTFPRKIWVSFH